MAIGSEFKKLKKEIIRPQFLELREKMDRKVVDSKSIQIQKRFAKLVEYDGATTIMFYFSVGNEVKTDRAIRQALKEKKRVVLPVCDVDQRNIIPVEMGSTLKKGPFGIPEPVGIPVNKNEVDIVVVPVVSFDEECDRLGRGLGYYDNFLSDIRAFKVGFAFECQKTENVPREDEDVQLDRIVTETRIIASRK